MTKDEALVKYNEIDRRIGIRPFWEVRDIIENLCSQIEELQNRSCENCIHYKQSSTQIYKTCYANKVNGFNLESDIDFSCNKWEVKK